MFSFAVLKMLKAAPMRYVLTLKRNALSPRTLTASGQVYGPHFAYTRTALDDISFSVISATTANVVG